jgi:hypothetical protein
MGSLIMGAQENEQTENPKLRPGGMFHCLEVQIAHWHLSSAVNTSNNYVMSYTSVYYNSAINMLYTGH